jgi:hypothetical protein
MRSHFLNYMYTYTIGNASASGISNFLSADEKYLLIFLCLHEQRYNGCQSPTLHQVSIVAYNSFVSVKNYLPIALSLNYTKIGNAASQAIKRISTSEIINDRISFQMSYISPVIYKDYLNNHHLFFYSGGRNMENDICGDIFFYEVVVTEFFDGSVLNRSPIRPEKIIFLNIR